MRSSQLIQGKPAPYTRPSQGLVCPANETRLPIQHLALAQDHLSVELDQCGKIFLTNQIGPNGQSAFASLVDPKNLVEHIGRSPYSALYVENEGADTRNSLCTPQGLLIRPQSSFRLRAFRCHGDD